MTAAAPQERSGSNGAAPPAPTRRGLRALATRVLIALAFLVAVGLSAGVAVRLGVRTDLGRALVLRLLDGLDLGPVGRLHVRGLRGDLFEAFVIQDVSVEDARGPWLHAQDLSVVWEPRALFERRLLVTNLQARLITLARQPLLAKTPAKPPTKPPLSLEVDAFRWRLRTEAPVGGVAGAWEVAGKALVRRDGSVQAAVRADSLMHAGDGARLLLRLGRRSRFILRADAVESQGGALAGTLGLPLDKPLAIHATGDGTGALGRASASASSGGGDILRGEADWGPSGLAVKGTASLAASRLTRYLADRLGSEARLTATGRPLGGSLYDVSADAQTEGGRLTLVGPLDLGRRASPGLRVDLSVKDLSHWLPQPKIGFARVTGTATGSLSGWDFKGDFTGSAVDQFGYHLEKAAGPLEVGLHDQEWRIQTDLRGSGGGGASLPLAALGPAPQIHLDLSILRSGRLLFRSIKAAGAAVGVEASGGQDLFGGLVFKGELKAERLQALRSDLRGALTASWSAHAGEKAAAWDFTFRADADHFGSGVTNLDHFLGPSPHLTAAGSYGLGPGLSIAQSQLTGAQLEVAAKGSVDAAGALGLTLDWTAKGPLVAGPMEIVGSARGAGKVSGTLSSPRADVTADIPSLNAGPLVIAPARLSLSVLSGEDGMVGAASLEGPAGRYGPASAKASFRAAGDVVELSDVVADAGGLKFIGSVGLKDWSLDHGDLTLAAGPGAFLASGRLEGAIRLSQKAGQASGRVTLDGQNMSLAGQALRVRSLKLSGLGPLVDMPLRISAEGGGAGPWSFTGSGRLQRRPADTVISLEGGGRIKAADFHFLQPARLSLAGADQSVQLDVAVGGGRLNLDGRKTATGISARAELAKISVGAFNEDFVGELSGVAALDGQGDRLVGSLETTLAGIRGRDAAPSEGLTGTIKATLSGDRVHVAAEAGDAEGLKSKAELDLPAEATAAPFRIALNRTKPIAGQFSADGEIRPLWDLFAGGERSLSGRVSTAGTLSGDLNKIRASGQASLSGGRFRDVLTGLELQKLQVDAAFGDDALTVRQFSGVDEAGGGISGDGRVSLADDGPSTFTLNLRKFRLLDNDLGRATASGAVVVTHPAKGQGKLSGSLVIDRADIVATTPTPTGVVPLEVKEIHKLTPDGEESAPVRSLGPPINLDVSIKASRGVYVKGKGLNVELSLDAHVGGTVNAPDLEGSAKVVGGRYDFAGKRFDVENSGVIHLGTSPKDIRLDLSATWEDPTLTAVVRVQGTAAKPEITLTSIPVLPQDEVLARVLFGVSASQLSAAEGAELASALASLAGGGGFDVIGNLRQFAGLDRLALGSTQTSATTISGGKYISKDVYLELTGGSSRNGSGAQVEWRIRKNLSLVSRYGAALDPRYPNDSDASLSIRFRTDF